MTELAKVAVLGAVILVAVGCAPSEPAMVTDPNRARVDAEWTLRTAADDRDAETRMNALEALSQVAGDKAGRIYMQGLSDPAEGVRFVAAIAVGETKYAPAKAKLIQMASDDPKVGEPDRRVYAAVLYALYELKEKSYARGLAKLLRDDLWQVRDSAALVLGKMGNPISINLLKLQLGAEMNNLVKVRIVESLAMLGDTHSLMVLASYTQENSLDQTLIAIDAMANTSTNTRESGFARTLGYLTQPNHPPRVRIRAAGALAQLGHFDKGAYDYVRTALADPELVLQDAYKGQVTITPLEAKLTQELAAKSLGLMGQLSAIDALTPVLKDSFGPLRVSAARSILQLLPPQSELLPATRPAASQPATKPAAQAAPTTNPAATAHPRVKLNTAGARD